jgi:excisionase family DNA binding protein
MGLERLLTLAEAGRRLGSVSPHTIKAWMRKGKLKKTMVGGRLRVRESDLVSFVEECNPPRREPIDVKCAAANDRGD